MQADESELLAQSLRRDTTAYDELIRRYQQALFRHCYAIMRDEDEAEDVAQEAFIAAYYKLDTFDQSRRFSTWLFKIASNNCIDFIRNKRVQVTSMSTGRVTEDGAVIYFDVRADNLNPEETIVQDQKIKLMRELVSKLKPRYKELVEKRYFEELSYEEIAEELNLPIGTVKAQLFRARDFLASMMDKSKDTI